MRWDLRVNAFIILLLVCFASKLVAQGVILGVLEEVPGVYYQEPSTRKMRVVFHKTGMEWKAYPSNCLNLECLRAAVPKFPSEATWNVAFDGRSIGQVTARTQEDFGFYSHVGLQNITSKGPVPTIGAKSKEYGGYPEATVYRPLVAISRPFFKDPEAWKAAQLDNGTLASLRKAFRRKSPKLCRQSKEDETELDHFLTRMRI